MANGLGTVWAGGGATAGYNNFSFGSIHPSATNFLFCDSSVRAISNNAALGVLISTRNFLPPLLGAPLMWPYLSSAMDGRTGNRGLSR